MHRCDDQSPKQPGDRHSWRRPGYKNPASSEQFHLTCSRSGEVLTTSWADKRSSGPQLSSLRLSPTAQRLDRPRLHHMIFSSVTYTGKSCSPPRHAEPEQETTVNSDEIPTSYRNRKLKITRKLKASNAQQNLPGTSPPGKLLNPNPPCKRLLHLTDPIGDPSTT